ncbi:MAG TPA: GNAT family N-acetyltransferase [Chitinophagaceae bacterium]
MPITIRYAAVADAPLIADMSRQTFYDTFAAQNTKEDMDKFMNEQFTKELLIKEVEASNNTFLLAFDLDEPVGYVRIRENNIPPASPTKNAIEIARIYAVTSSIGKGVGKSLMQKCIDIAREKKVEAIWLGVWEKNERAIRFYEQWGFEKFSDHRFILGNDVQNDWLMIKYV